MTDLGSVYGAGRRRLIELVSSLSEEELRATVAACPDWNVHDVLAHLSGICADVLSGNTAGAATDPWTAAQVEARRDWPVAKVLEEWEELGAQIDPIVSFFPGRVNEQFVFDMHTHEQDIRQAVGRPGARDSEGVEVGAVFATEVGLLTGLANQGLPPIEIVCGDRRWVSASALPEGADGADYAGQVLRGEAPPAVGDEEPAGSLKVTPFELFRAAAGRRSRQQLRALAWTVDPEPYLDVFQFGPFSIRAEDLVE